MNIPLISGIRGNAGRINYSSAKVALVSMAKTRSEKWGRHKVCVNGAAFGLIGKRPNAPKAIVETDGRPMQAGLAADALERFRYAVASGREGTPEEAAGAICPICIPESDVGGQRLLVAGGMNL